MRRRERASRQAEPVAAVAPARRRLRGTADIDIPDVPRRPPRRWLRRAEWLYLAGAVAAVAAVKVGGDRWGWATLLAYGPRWVALLPAAPLLAWAAWRGRVPWATLAALAVVAGPLLRFNIPVARAAAGDGPVALKVMTCNILGKRSDPAALARLVADERPDVVALQEIRRHEELPAWASGGDWHAGESGGILLLSRFPILQKRTFDTDGRGSTGAIIGCELLMPDGRHLWAFVVHLETPRRAFEPLLDGEPGAWSGLARNATHRARLSQAAAGWVAETAAGGSGPVPGEVVILGDFNLVGDGRIFRGAWAFWTDAFESAGWGYGFTKAQRTWSLRIDHVLAGNAFRPLRCWVGPDIGSDHLPVLAEFARSP